MNDLFETYPHEGKLKIHTRDRGYVEVEAKKIYVSTFTPRMYFFLHRPLNYNYTWTISEYKTGCGICSNKNIELTEANLESNLSRVKKYNFIRKIRHTIKKHGQANPKWRKPKHA